jgi:hypothetical protein
MSPSRATALALRKLALAARAVADQQRRRAEALRELADAYVGEADDGVTARGGGRFHHALAAHAVRLAGSAEADARTYDQEAARAVEKARALDERAPRPPPAPGKLAPAHRSRVQR